MAFSAHKSDAAMKEHYDDAATLQQKVQQVGEMIKNSRHTVIFTGAGISTDAGIPDFRGPKGVWTCKAKGVAPPRGVSTLSAIPTKTHMSIVQLIESGKLQYVISQNCDGLHRRSGVPADRISELHGNGNIEFCETCGYEYLRDFSCYRITNSSDHYTGRHCVRVNSEGRKCNGRLMEYTIDFGQSLPERPLTLAYEEAAKAELHIALGSSLTVSPANEMPKLTAKTRGKLVICNLQNTPLDKYASVRIYQRTDAFMIELMRYLDLPIPEFSLHRSFRINLSTPESNSPKVNVRLLGIAQGTDGQEIPASLCKSVEIYHKEFRDQFAIHNYQEQIPSFVLSGPKVSLEKLGFRVHTMQHYAEPPLEFTVDPSWLTRSSIKLNFRYFPSTGEWHNLPNDEGACEIGLNEEQSQKLCYSPTLQPIPGAAFVDQRFWASLSLVLDSGNNTVVLLAGGAPEKSTSEPSLFMFKNSSWQSISKKIQTSEKNMPFAHRARWGHSACVVENHYVFFMGGWDSNSQYFDVYLFDTRNMSLESVMLSGQVPSPRAGHSCVLSEALQSLYVFGGSCCKGGPYEFYNDLYRYDPGDHSFEKINLHGEIPTPRSQHSAVVINDHQMVIIGGYNGYSILNDVYVINLDSGLSQRIECSGNGPLPRDVDRNDFRVCPAYNSALLMRPDNYPIILYCTPAGIFFLDLNAWTWVPPVKQIMPRGNTLGVALSTDYQAAIFNTVDFTYKGLRGALYLLKLVP